MSTDFRQISNTIWNVADLLRGSWKSHEYQDVILPLTVLKRLDAALEPTKQEVLTRFNEIDGKVSDLRILRRISGYDFYNTSPYTIKKLLDEPTHLQKNIRNYIDGFSDNVKDIFKKFKFDIQLDRLKGGDLLYLILTEFNKIDLHPDKVANDVIGLAFEDLIRRFAEQSNETAGEHYTPRDVVALMTALLFVGEEEELKKRGVVRTLYDPACGTGGMLTVGKEYILKNFNENATIYLFGQELNGATYAICKADMLLKGEDPERIKGGDEDHSLASTLSTDQHSKEKFDYIISNPPYGVEWKKDQKAVEKEAERGMSGRFGAGLPRISDGQFLFLEHIISKFKSTSDGGSDAVVITNGSPLFTGDAGQGESNIRRWLIENDYIDSIIALPDQLFFNTGIPTYIWVFSNRKAPEKKNKILLIDAREEKKSLRKNLGNKRYEISDISKNAILDQYLKNSENENSKIFNSIEFGYRAVTIQRPLKLRFDINEETIRNVSNSKFFLNEKISKKKGSAGEDENNEWKILKDEIVSALYSLIGNSFLSRKDFITALEAEFKNKSLKVSSKLVNSIWKEIGVQDDEAEICFDKDGNPEPNNDLKDVERIPLKEDVDEYFNREIKPYIPDAWIDASVVDDKDGKIGKIGYEIPFTRYFYKYIAPRDSAEVQEEIMQLDEEIQKLMREI